MQGLKLTDRDQSLGYTTLVANHDDAETRSVEQSDHISHTREKVHFFPTRNVPTFRGFSVDHPVTIQKHSFAHGVSPVLPVPK
jgi:hypothetical protein